MSFFWEIDILKLLQLKTFFDNTHKIWGSWPMWPPLARPMFEDLYCESNCFANFVNDSDVATTFATMLQQLYGLSR